MVERCESHGTALRYRSHGRKQEEGWSASEGRYAVEMYCPSVCGAALALFAQLYAPVDAYHRVLYVLVCNAHEACSARREGWAVLRRQVPMRCVVEPESAEAEEGRGDAVLGGVAEASPSAAAAVDGGAPAATGWADATPSGEVDDGWGDVGTWGEDGENEEEVTIFSQPPSSGLAASGEASSSSSPPHGTAAETAVLVGATPCAITEASFPAIPLYEEEEVRLAATASAASAAEMRRYEAIGRRMLEEDAAELEEEPAAGHRRGGRRGGGGAGGGNGAGGGRDAERCA